MTTIKLKNGSGAPTAGDLVQGEPALDLTNKRLYTEDSGGTVIEVGTNPGTDVTFADNRKAVFGAGSDLEIFSDGTNGRISLNSASGNLRMLADEFQLANTGYTNFYLTTTAADAVRLFHGGNQKFETTSTGIDVTGTAVIETGSGNTYPTASTSADNLVISDKTASTPVGITIFSDNASQGNIFFGDENDADNGRIVYDHNGNANTMSFYANGAERLSVDSTGIDVTGTVTADGLTVDASTSQMITLNHSTPSNLTTLGQDSSGDFRVRSDSVNKLKSYANGDFELYEDTGTTAKLFWDASAESLGIGTSSPDRLLHLNTGTTGAITPLLRLEGQFTSNTGNEGTAIEFITGSGGTEVGARIIATREAAGARGALRFCTGRENDAGFDDGNVVIDESGNVGIGTSSPSYNLQIDDASSATLQLKDLSNSGTASVFFADAAQNTPGFIQYNNGGDYFRFGTSGSERMRIDSSGRVGINRTPSISNSKLEVSGADNVPLINVEASGNTGGIGIGSTGFQFFHGSTARMRIDASGNVGINQSNPTRKLHVTSAGSGVVATFGDSVANNTIEVTRTTTNASYIGLSATSAVGGIIAGPTFTFSTCNSGGGAVTERARIDSSGTFLVGTSSSVGGRIQAERTVFADSGNDAWKKGAFVGTGSYGGAISLINTGGGSDGFAFYLTGNPSVLNVRHGSNGGTMANGVQLLSTATAWAAYSDSRLKTITSEISNAIASVNTLRAVKYTFNNDDANTPRVGLIAQEVQEVLPEAVEVVDDDGHLGLRYTEIIPLLVAAIKEQQTTIQDLKARVLTLEGEN